MTPRRAVLWLALVCLVWGASFTLTKQALALASPLLYMGLRFGLAALVVLPVLRRLTPAELRAGLVLGLLFWAGFVFQTVGLAVTTPSRSAFITSLSSPLTPLVAFLVHRAVPRASTLGGIALATVGTYLLTAPATGGMNRGDVLTLGCAVLFAGQIVAAAHYARRFDATRLVALQLGLAALLSLAAAPGLERPRLEPGLPLAVLVLVLAFTGLWSFQTQLRAQRFVTPSQAALVFMLEPVFGAAVSYLALGERLAPVQWAGAALILLAMAVPALDAEPAEPAAEPAAVTAARPEGERRVSGG